MTVEISKAELAEALAALGEVGASVYGARKKKDGTIVLDIVGRRMPVEYKPKAKAAPKRKAPAKKKEKDT
jgi:hypothetical protein